MEFNINGYLNLVHNPDLIINGEWNEKIKTIFIKILDIKDIKKIKNVIKNWSSTLNVKPYYNCYEGGLMIKISTQKIRKYMGLKMIQSNDRFDKCYSIRLSIKNWSIYDKHSSENIYGISFILKKIELI